MRRRQLAARFALCTACFVAFGCGPRLNDGASADDSTDDAVSTHAPTEGEVTSTTVSGTTAPTTTTTSGESTDDGTSETEEEPLVCDHDFPRGVFECDPWVQDCPEGEKCVAWTNTGGYYDSTRCVPLADETKGLGETCTIEGLPTTGVDDCDVGAKCWQWGAYSERVEPVCVSLCRGCFDAPECPEGSLCFVSGNNTLNLCIPECDPLRGACPTNTMCVYVPDRGCTFVCGSLPDSALPPGESCTYTNECGQGVSCIHAETFGPACEGDKCCSPFCDPNDSEADAMCDMFTPGQSCVPLCGRENPEVGVCGVVDP